MSMAVDLQHLSCKTWKIIFRIIEDFLTENEFFSSLDSIFSSQNEQRFVFFSSSNREEKKNRSIDCSIRWNLTRKTAKVKSFVAPKSMAAGTHMAATQQAADDQASSLYFSGICQTISVKCQHRNENGLLTCSRNLYVSCKQKEKFHCSFDETLSIFRSTLSSVTLY